MDGYDRQPPALHTREQWEAVARDFALPHLTRNEICRKHGVTMGQLLDRARTHKWQTERTEFTDRHLLIERMMAALELQTRRLEITDMTRTTDKDATTLARLATTLDKLIDIGERSRMSPGAGENMKELRNKLAQRIENLQSE